MSEDWLKKYRKTMIAKYGSEEAWHEAMRKHGAKARRTGKGGFHALKNSDPDKLSTLSREAANKRWANAKNN